MKRKKTIAKVKTKKPLMNTSPSKTKPLSKVPRATNNPFRVDSAYAVGFDILHAHPVGLPRKRLVELMAKATRKSVEKAGYDAAVVLSAKNSPTGPRHRSCREGFWVERDGDLFKLRTN
jgi:hypothetical protein